MHGTRSGKGGGGPGLRTAINDGPRTPEAVSDSLVLTPIAAPTGQRCSSAPVPWQRDRKAAMLWT